MDSNELKGFLHGGKLVKYPAKRKKKLLALYWLSEFITPGKAYTEAEFNELLNKLHSFGDPAALRRDLYDFGLVDRSADGSCYRLRPERPSLVELLEKNGVPADGKGPANREESRERPAPACGDRELKEAAEFRNSIHEQALERVQRIRPDVRHVVDRYPVEAYFQQVWDYPGAWYTVAAIPEGAKSREALIDTIVRDTLRENG